MLLRAGATIHRHGRHVTVVNADELTLHMQRRQSLAAADVGRRAFGKRKIGECVRCDQCLPGRQDKILQVVAPELRGISHIDRQRDRLDAEQAKAASADLHMALHDRRDLPAGAAQLDEQLLRKCPTRARDKGCRHKTCDRPAAWCDGHHLKHWADGGLHELPNLVLLCRRHHRMEHEGRAG